jgi:hypothetical protein
MRRHKRNGNIQLLLRRLFPRILYQVIGGSISLTGGIGIHYIRETSRVVAATHMQSLNASNVNVTPEDVTCGYVIWDRNRGSKAVAFSNGLSLTMTASHFGKSLRLMKRMRMPQI